MDRNLPLKPTLAFLTCVLLIVGAFFYFAPVTIKPPIGQLYRNADNQLIALEANYLVGISEGSKNVSMASFLHGNHVGQMIPLHSGDLIINGKGQSRDILLNFKSLLRISDTENDEATSLLKCDAQMTHCQPWGDEGLFFRMGWSGLELRNEQILINDSTRHRVLLLSSDGRILSQLGGFKFPNHAVEVDDTIWITDTNHDQIVAIRVSDDKLIRTGKTIPLSNYKGIHNQHRFPSIAQLGAENHWWVMVNDHNMAHPGIYRLNADNTATQIASHMDDITSMLVEESQLFITSYPDNQVWRFDSQTLTGTPFPSANLLQINQIVEQQVAKQKITLWSLIGGIGLIALTILAYAIKTSSPAAYSTLSVNHDLVDSNDISTLKSPKVSGIVWISKKQQFTRQMKIVTLGSKLFLPMLVFLVIGLWFFVKPLSIHHLIVIVVVMMIGSLATLLVPRFTKGFTEYELGSDKNHLILRHIQTDKRTIVLGKDIVYTKYAFYAAGVFFQVKNPKLGLAYDIQPFKQYALPVIKQGQQISEWAMMKQVIFIGT